MYMCFERFHLQEPIRGERVPSCSLSTCGEREAAQAGVSDGGEESVRWCWVAMGPGDPKGLIVVNGVLSSGGQTDVNLGKPV